MSDIKAFVVTVKTRSTLTLAGAVSFAACGFAQVYTPVSPPVSSPLTTINTSALLSTTLSVDLLAPTRSFVYDQTGANIFSTAFNPDVYAADGSAVPVQTDTALRDATQAGESNPYSLAALRLSLGLASSSGAADIRNSGGRAASVAPMSADSSQASTTGSDDQSSWGASSAFGKNPTGSSWSGKSNGGEEDSGSNQPGSAGREASAGGSLGSLGSAGSLGSPGSPGSPGSSVSLGSVASAGSPGSSMPLASSTLRHRSSAGSQASGIGTSASAHTLALGGDGTSALASDRASDRAGALGSNRTGMALSAPAAGMASQSPGGGMKSGSSSGSTKRQNGDSKASTDAPLFSRPYTEFSFGESPFSPPGPDGELTFLNPNILGLISPGYKSRFGKTSQNGETARDRDQERDKGKDSSMQTAQSEYGLTLHTRGTGYRSSRDKGKSKRKTYLDAGEMGSKSP